ncbi:MAG: 50S ribosomal protein L28 [Proteobacteria bacterium]|nr:50S ribosomal protein L28 [Pseudomonadota bacterium]
MPRVCQVTNKKTQVGMNVSHSHRRTKRTFKPNLQTCKFHSDILGRDFSLLLSTAGLRTLTKHGGLDQYVVSKPVSRLTPDMAAVKKAIEKKLSATKKPAAKPVKKPAHKPNKSARLIKKTAAKKTETKK